MADTTFLKREVPEYVRSQLAVEFGISFQPRALRLVTGGEHAFSAVSDDGRVVASIKTLSGRTSSGKNPSGKINNAVAELHYLSQVTAARKLLVLTNAEFHTILSRKMEGRMPSGVALKLIPLPPAMARRVREVQGRASKEVFGL